MILTSPNSNVRQLKKVLFLPIVGTGGALGFLLHGALNSYLGNVLHCLLIGATLGLVNYAVVSFFIDRYFSLKDANRVLHKENRHDMLTGTLNRKAFKSDYPLYLGSARFSILFIDINDFKKYNDSYGHDVADLVLAKLGQVMKDTLRCGDAVYRWGGDEFLVILADCDKSSAYTVAEKLEVAIADIDVSPYPTINVSLGISSFPDDATAISDLVKLADNHMYCQKKARRA